MPKFRIYELTNDTSRYPVAIYVPEEINASADDVVAYANKNFCGPSDAPLSLAESGNVQTLELTMEDTVALLHTKNHYKP